MTKSACEPGIREPISCLAIAEDAPFVKARSAWAGESLMPLHARLVTNCGASTHEFGLRSVPRATVHPALMISEAFANGIDE